MKLIFNGRPMNFEPFFDPGDDEPSPLAGVDLSYDAPMVPAGTFAATQPAPPGPSPMRELAEARRQMDLLPSIPFYAPLAPPPPPASRVVGVSVKAYGEGDPSRALLGVHEAGRMVEGIELRLHVGPIAAIEIVVVENQGAGIRVVLAVPDRDDPRRTIEVVFNGPMIERTKWTQLEFAHAIRETCFFALRHELEEGVHVEGKRVFDPHPPQPLNEWMAPWRRVALR